MEIKAWAVVNKDFEKEVKKHPWLFVGEFFFTEQQANGNLLERFPNKCSECGTKKKVDLNDLPLKVIPITIIL